MMRGKPWSKDEENQLRLLVKEGKGFDEISSIMGKSRLSVKGKLFNSGLNSVIVESMRSKQLQQQLQQQQLPQRALLSLQRLLRLLLLPAHSRIKLLMLI